MKTNFVRLLMVVSICFLSLAQAYAAQENETRFDVNNVLPDPLEFYSQCEKLGVVKDRFREFNQPNYTLNCQSSEPVEISVQVEEGIASRYQDQYKEIPAVRIIVEKTLPAGCELVFKEGSRFFPNKHRRTMIMSSVLPVKQTYGYGMDFVNSNFCQQGLAFEENEFSDGYQSSIMRQQTTTSVF